MTKCDIGGLGIHLKVSDIEKSRQFYESLGFVPIFGYGDERFRSSLPEGVNSAPERYRGITYQVDENTNFEIAEGHIAIKDERVFKDVIESPKVSAMVRVKSLASLFENPLVNITFPVRHYYWGTIEVAFRDPDGFVLVFTTPYSEEEFEKIGQLTNVEVIKMSDK